MIEASGLVTGVGTTESTGVLVHCLDYALKFLFNEFEFLIRVLPGNGGFLDWSTQANITHQHNII